MFNRIGVVAASATLIAIAPLAASTAAVMYSEANLSASSLYYGQEHPLVPPIRNYVRSNFSGILEFSDPTTLVCNKMWVPCHF
ncbi:MAG: hypothetical protein Kow00121_58980 [Elainellaceae cyanobacterium]